MPVVFQNKNCKHVIKVTDKNNILFIINETFSIKRFPK